jgi:LiaI-LiaF-like transmembrane region
MNGSDISLARAVRGPVTLITLGILFALNNFTPYGFSQTWPVLLIVFGLLSLWGRSEAPPARPAPHYPPRNWNYTPPPPPPPPTAPGGYRESPYTGANVPAGTPRGGFGNRAPGQPAEPGPTSTPGEST